MIPATQIIVIANAMEIASTFFTPFFCSLFTSGFSKIAITNEKAIGASISLNANKI